MKQPELDTTSEKIDKLISRINSGDVKIPAFQRAYVWKQAQILDLLDSVLRNYPIGSVLLWHTSERLKHTRNIAGYDIPVAKEEYPVNYVLDGQQRLSSIYATFSDQTKQDTASEQYNPNPDIFEIYYDFEKSMFLPKAEAVPDSNKVIYLRGFMNLAKSLETYKKLDPQYLDAAQQLYSQFTNYELPVVTIKHRGKEEVGIIFERINNTGTKLSVIDLMTAWTWTDDFHLLNEMNDLVEELDEKNFGDVSRQILLQALSGVLQNDTTTQAILKLKGEAVRDAWKNFCDSLKKAIDFLSTEIQCLHYDFLPYQQQLVILCKFFSIAGDVKPEQLQAIKRFFWKTSFSNRYSTGQTTSKMNTDIDVAIEIRKGNLKPVDSYSYTVTTKELRETRFSKGNPLTRAFLLLMAQHSPLDLIKGVKIDITKALSEYNRKQYHHVFPNAHLKNQSHPANRIFSLMNFCFLPADSNKKISAKKPSDYFENLLPQDKFNEILQSNVLPLKKEIYLTDDYLDFLERRAELTLTELDKLTT